MNAATAAGGAAFVAAFDDGGTVAVVDADDADPIGA